MNTSTTTSNNELPAWLLALRETGNQLQNSHDKAMKECEKLLPIEEPEIVEEIVEEPELTWIEEVKQTGNQLQTAHDNAMNAWDLFKNEHFPETIVEPASDLTAFLDDTVDESIEEPIKTEVIMQEDKHIPETEVIMQEDKHIPETEVIMPEDKHIPVTYDNEFDELFADINFEELKSEPESQTSTEEAFAFLDDDDDDDDDFFAEYKIEKAINDITTKDSENAS